MKKIFIIILASLILVFTINPSVLAKSADESKLKVMDSYVKLPLYFIKNEGQLDEAVKYYERSLEHSTYFTEEGIYFVLSKKNEGSDVEGKSFRADHVVIKFEGANRAEVLAEEQLKGRVNYFIGNDPERWRRDIPIYGKVRYREVYRGIDLVFYGNQRQFEYDIVIKPGANPEDIKFRVEGAKEVKDTEDGGIEIVLSDGLSIFQKIPHVYQDIEGRRVEVHASFKITKDEESYSYSLTIGDYSKMYTLVIDPIVLSYSTYLGGSDFDGSRSIAVDVGGNVYVTGYTYSTNFPMKNAYQSSYKGGGDVFVTKLSFELLKLFQPNGGQKWKAGYKYVIKWQASLNSYKFNLKYSTDNKTTWTNIATVLASNRCTSDGTKYSCTYGWSIPAQDGRKPQSFVRVRSFNSSNQVIGTDDSDKAFVIDVLRLTSPNGGETLKVGSTHTITWDTYALTKTVAKVILQYSTNGGQSWTNIKTFVGSNPGQFNWTVPNTPSTNCKVRVILKDSTGAEIARDASDKVFTIQQ